MGSKRRPRGWATRSTVVIVALTIALCVGFPMTLTSADPTLAASPWPASALPRSDAPASQSGAAMDAFIRAFYVPFPDGTATFRDTTLGSHADFWKEAEMIEMIEDAWQATRDPSYRSMVKALVDGVLSSYGTVWTRRRWNDDAMWMIIAAVRAHRITGDPRYLRLARENFDRTYARSWSPDYGGGLWLTSRRTQKNATSTAPGVIAACRLYAETHDRRYLDAAVGLYAWMRTCLFDPASGLVYDNIAATPEGGYRYNGHAYTYNQGTFIGAADLLATATGSAAYLADAQRALDYVRGTMSAGGFLPGEGDGGDGDRGGFKGIFIRYALHLVRDHHLNSYLPWFRLNADAAFAHRDARGLIGCDWSVPTSSGPLFSFDCSSAVVLLAALRTDR